MSKKLDKVARLRAVSMFAVCTDKELAEVARLAEELPVATGEVLVTQGKTEHEFYVLTAGTAEVVRDGTVVATLAPGDYFGELALLDPHPRTATVTMTSAGSVLEMSQREFWQLLTDVPSLSRKLLQGLARRMHAAEAQS